MTRKYIRTHACSALIAAALPLLPPAIYSTMNTAMAQSSPFASAPVDRRLYREDAVRRISLRAGGWQADCDEIIPLKRRYCSLSTVLVERAGGIAARLAVSTGDDGRPALLLHLPHGLILSRPANLSSLTVESKTSGNKTSKTRVSNSKASKSNIAQRQLKPVSCDARGCAIIWRPQSGEIKALRSGGSLEIVYWRWRSGVHHPLLLADPRHHERAVLQISGAGFAEALRAALNSK